jgi:PAS domain S-box-containing protein
LTIGGYPIEDIQDNGTCLKYDGSMTSSLPLTQLLSPDVPFRRLADRVPMLLWAARPDGTCVFRNRAWLDFCGRALEAELGDGWLDAVHPEDRARVRSSWSAVVPGAETFHIEYRLRRADGRYRRIADHGVSWTGPDGDIDGMLGAAADITDTLDPAPPTGDGSLRFGTLLESAHDMFYRIALFPAPRVEFACGSVVTIYGRPADAFYW